MTEKNNMTLVLVILGLLIITLFAITSKPKIIVNPSSDTNTISVSGRTELTVDPDEFELYIEIQTLEWTAKETKDENAEISDDVIAALKKAGVKSSDIETNNYYLYPKYEWNRETEESELVGYELRHTLKVTHDDLDKAGDLIDTAVDAGANRVDRIVFTLSDDKEKEVTDEAMGKAALNAKEKAEALASSLNVKLGKIKTISESNYYFEPFRYSGDMLEVAVAGKAESTSIQPQKLEVSATVNVAFEIN